MKRNDRATKFTLILCSLLLILTLMLCSCDSGSGSPSKGGSTDSSFESPEKPGVGSDGLLNTSYAENTDQKIIHTCTVEGETKQFDSAAAALSDAISSAGGYIESQQATGTSYNGSGHSSRHLTAVVRVPVDQYDSFVSGLGNIMNVTKSSSNAQNITEPYYDAEARLKTLKAEHESLQKMMASIDTAVQFDFWLTLQKRLSETEQDIAALEAKLRGYDNKVSYSTVTIALREVVELTVAQEPTFGNRVSKAFTSSWENFGEFWQNVAVFIVSVLPVIVTIAVMVIVILTLVLIASRKKKK